MAAGETVVIASWVIFESSPPTPVAALVTWR